MKNDIKKPVPFKLQIGGEKGIDNADVPVRWCITPEFVKQMDEDGIADPHILLVSVDPKKGEMERVLVPVSAIMTWVRFYRSGEMKLFGWIVDGSAGRKKLNKDFIAKTRGSYETDLIDEDYEVYTNEETDDRETHWFYKAVDDISRTYIGTEETVNIPSTVFGKEPRPALKWYVNLWHRNRLNDQCHFRQRAALAFTLKPFGILIYSFFAILFRGLFASFIALSGWPQNIEWKYIWRPFKYTNLMFLKTDGEDAFDPNCTEWWATQRFMLFRTNKEGNRIPHFVMLPFTPIISIVIFVAVYYCTGLIENAAIETGKVLILLTMLLLFASVLVEIVTFLAHDLPSVVYTGWHKVDMAIADRNLWPLTIVIMSVIILGLVVLGITWLISFVNPLFVYFFIAVVIFGLCYSKLMDFIFDSATRAERNDPTEIRELLCPMDTMNLKATYKAVPKEQRTIRLWLQNIKNSICKPMQQ